MSEDADPSVLRRKLSQPSPDVDDGSPSVPRALRLAFCKTADKFMNLVLAVTPNPVATASLKDLQEVADPSDLLLCLRTPEGALGLAIMDVQLRAGLIEMQTMGKVARAEAPNRSATRTDAKLVEPALTALLEEFDDSVTPFKNRHWAMGYRPGLMLEGPRLIGLVLEDVRFKLFDFDVDMSIGSKKGKLRLAFVQDRIAEEEVTVEAPIRPDFSELLGASLDSAKAELSAVLDVLYMPVSDVSNLEEGQLLKISPTALQSIRLQGGDGKDVARGVLGEDEGVLAVRLTSASLPASKGRGMSTLATSSAPSGFPAEAGLPSISDVDTSLDPLADMGGMDALPDLPADDGLGTLPDMNSDDLSDLPGMGSDDLSDLPGMSEDELDQEFDFAQMGQMQDLPEIAS